MQQTLAKKFKFLEPSIASRTKKFYVEKIKMFPIS